MSSSIGGFDHAGMESDFGNLAGKHFTDKGFVSTTLHREQAEGYNILAEIRVPKGTRAAGLDQVHPPIEQEILLSRSSNFKITHAFERDGQKHVVMEYVGIAA